MQPGDLKPCLGIESDVELAAALDEWADQLDGLTDDGAAILTLASRRLRAAPALPPVPDVEALVERLRAKFTVRDEFSTTHPLVNPDGPEAAAALQSQAAECARLLKAGDRLRTALLNISGYKTGGPYRPGQIKSEHRVMIQIAREALGPTP